MLVSVAAIMAQSVASMPSTCLDTGSTLACGTPFLAHDLISAGGDSLFPSVRFQ